MIAGVLFLFGAAVAFGVTSFLADSPGRPARAGPTARSSAPTTTPRGGRPWLGIDLAGFSLGNGAVIGDVIPGSPAENAGLQPGDVISRLGSQPISQPVDVDTAIARLHPGSKVEIEFLRGANTYTTTVTLAKAPPGYP